MFSRRVRRFVLRTLLPCACVACGAGEPAKTSPPNAAAVAQKQPGAPTDSAVPAPVDSAPPSDSVPPPPLKRYAGYLVKGTDELSFLTCGTGKVHHVRMPPMVSARVMNEYRFRTRKLLSPVYFVFLARVVPDTVLMGDNRYTTSIEVAETVGERDDRPDCPAPRRGSLVGRYPASR